MKRRSCDAFSAPTNHDEANHWRFELAGQTREKSILKLAHEKKITQGNEGVKVLAIEFANGKRIHALSSNPRAHHDPQWQVGG